MSMCFTFPDLMTIKCTFARHSPAQASQYSSSTIARTGLNILALALPTLAVAQGSASMTAISAGTSTGGVSALSRTDSVQENLIIPLGDLKTLNFGGKITRIALGNGKVVSATTVDNSRLLLIAEQLGNTQMMVWAGSSVRTFRVQVIHPQLANTRAMLQDIVQRNSGLRLNEFDSRLVISGVAHQPVIDQLQKLAADLPGVLVNVQADQGAAATPSVLFRLHFVEVRKSLLQKLGVQWSQTMSGPAFGAQATARSGMPALGATGSPRGAYFGIATALTSNLNVYAQEGELRLLASPELTAKSGGKAKLQVGGEVPIPMAAGFGATSVEFKPYGILFDIAPSVDSDGTITAKLSTELSQKDPAGSVNGIPGFLTRSTSTEVSLRDGETFALSGLLNSELSNTIDKVPGLGNIPILGRLFSSDDYRNERTELVVLVQVEIIQKGVGMANEMMDRGERNMRDYQELSEQYSVPSGRRPLPKKTAPETPKTLTEGR